MEQSDKDSTVVDNDDILDPNPVGLLQKRHSEPLHSHEVFLVPEAQPHSASAARGCNPWTGQTADEVREAAFSEYQFKKMQKEKAVTKDPHHAPVTPKPESKTSKEYLAELDELMFDTAMWRSQKKKRIRIL